MSTLISGYASYTRPKLAFRDVTGNFKPSEPDKNKLESLSFHKAVDLISEGTLDEEIVKSLRNKINLSAKVLGEEARQWLNLKPKS